MKPIYLLCLWMALLSTGKGVHAQAYPCSGAGPGETVVGETPAGNGVGSVPLCQRVDQGAAAPQPPPMRWLDKWGAIATDAATASLGSANGMSSREQAQDAALADCQAKGGIRCKTETWYLNGCGAMVMGNTGYNVGNAATLKKAIQSGIKVCRDAGDTNCHTYFSACSLPVRIQ